MAQFKVIAYALQRKAVEKVVEAEDDSDAIDIFYHLADLPEGFGEWEDDTEEVEEVEKNESSDEDEE
jgi:hypothetical protein